MLTEKRDKLEIIAQELLEKEILFQSDLERLVGPRPFEALTTYQAHTAGTDRSQTKSEVEQTHPVEFDEPNNAAPQQNDVNGAPLNNGDGHTTAEQEDNINTRTA